MKKLVALLFVAVFTLSCANDEVFEEKQTVNEPETAARLDEGVNVKVRQAYIADNSNYGHTQQIRNVEVELTNLAYDKEVYLVHEMEDGTWQEFPMVYSRSTPDNTEIWTINAEISGYAYEGLKFGNEFAIKYLVNGQEYWDNNDWNNYVTGGPFTNEYGTFNKTYKGTILREDIQVLVNTDKTTYNQYGTGGAGFNPSVVVRNIGYEKEVEVVYTTDGWNTVQVVPLEYVDESKQPSQWAEDTEYGTERWRTNINLYEYPETIEYAIVYKVNGQEYWDNNFGENYTIIKTLNY